jgi:uncharacterized protein YuzE
LPSPLSTQSSQSACGKPDYTAERSSRPIWTAQIETTKKIEPGIVANYDADGHIVGIEVLSVSKRGLPAAVGRAA